MANYPDFWSNKRWSRRQPTYQYSVPADEMNFMDALLTPNYQWQCPEGISYFRYIVIYFIGRWGHARLTILKLSDNQLYSGRTIWHGQSDQYCTKPLNSSLPLHHSTIAGLVILGRQAAHSPTRHRIHSHRSIWAMQWARQPRRDLSAGVPKRSPPVKRNGAFSL